MSSISAFADAARVFANHLADVKLGPLAVALLLHTINLLLRTGAWYSILRAAYPGVRYRYRSCAGAYLAGVGVNAIAPARGGDLVKIFLTRTRLEGSTTPTILASLLVETLIDAVLGIAILGYALTQHVLPRVPELPSLPAFEWSWAVANPTITAIIATFILLAAIITARRLHIAGKAFAARVRQGFTILRTPRRYSLTVAAPQLARLGLPRRRRGRVPRGLRHPGHAAQRAARDGRRLAHDAAPRHAGRRGHAAGADRRRAQRRGDRQPSCCRSRSARRRP